MTATTTTNNPSVLVDGIITIPDPAFRASISEHTPLLFDELTYEPYLPLPAPFEQFRITPQRKSDSAHVTEMMNDPQIVYWMDNHPFPFPPETAGRWVEQEIELAQEIFAAFAEGKWRPAKGSPLKVIREVVEPAEEGRKKKYLWVGDVDLRHAHWWSKRLTPVKDHWEEWKDKERIWSIGAGLKPSYQNRGIGSAAMSALFHRWGIPIIGCTEVRAGTYISNIKSNRVWEKLGFVESGLPEETVIVQKEKIGGEENRQEKSHILVWNLP